MLPAELLLLVCESLTPSDILSLSETCTSNKSALSHLRTLFLKYPWFDRDFSQWKNEPWSACVVSEPRASDFKMIRHPPSHFKKELPSDFQALRADCRRDEAFKWNVCDQGLYFNTGKVNGILDLRKDKTNALPDTPYPVRRVPKVKTSGYKIRYVSEEDRNDKVSAKIIVLEEKKEKTLLLVKYPDHKTVELELEPNYFHGLHLIGEMVIVSNGDLDSQPQYLLPGKTKLTTLTEAAQAAQYEGFMMYNGNLFKAELDCNGLLIVGRLDVEVDINMFEEPQRSFHIYQDERNPRYAMAYSQEEGLMVYLIDLHKYTVSVVIDRKDFCLPGVSKGKLGLWTYSPQELSDFGKQNKPLLKLVKKYMVNGLKGFLQDFGMFEIERSRRPR